MRLNNGVHLREAEGALHLHQEKLKLLQSSIAHIAALWVPNGHKRFKWVLPSFCQIEQDFDRLSFKDLRKRLRAIYQRLQRETLGV